MADLFTITYDAVADGAAIPDSGSGGEWDTVTGTAVGETDYAVASTRGAMVTGQASLRKTVTATNKWRLRWYEAHPVVAPGTNSSTAVARSSSTVRAQVRIETTGTYRLINGSTAVGSSSALPTAGQIDRYEWAVDGDAGTQALYIFKGSNRHGSTPDETLTGAYTNATADNIGCGMLSTLVTSYVVGSDSVKCTDTPGTLIGGTAQDATVTAPRVDAVVNVPSPAVALGVTVAAPVIAAVVAVPALVGQTGSTVSPDAIAAVVAMPAPTITAQRQATVLAPVVDAYVAFPAAQIVNPLNALVAAPVITATVAMPAPQRVGAPLGSVPSLDDLIFLWLGSRTTGATTADRERNYYAAQTGLDPSDNELSWLKRQYYGTQLALTATQIAQRSLVTLELAYWQAVNPANNVGSYQDRARKFYGG